LRIVELSPATHWERPGPRIGMSSLNGLAFRTTPNRLRSRQDRCRSSRSLPAPARQRRRWQAPTGRPAAHSVTSRPPSPNARVMASRTWPWQREPEDGRQYHTAPARHVRRHPSEDRLARSPGTPDQSSQQVLRQPPLTSQCNIAICVNQSQMQNLVAKAPRGWIGEAPRPPHPCPALARVRRPVI